VSVHFTRIRVTKISLAADSNAQLEISQLTAVASLLADADVDVTGWIGTSAGRLGFDRDGRLCKAMEEATGEWCTTSALALHKMSSKINATGFALLTPHSEEMNVAIPGTTPALE
jgi:maleate isomerase